MIRRGDLHGINVFLVEHRAEVRIHLAAISFVVSIHHALRSITTACEFALVAVVASFLHHIRDGDDLAARIAQKIWRPFDRDGAKANARDGDSLRRRRPPAFADGRGGDDRGKAKRRRGCGDEAAMKRRRDNLKFNFVFIG